MSWYCKMRRHLKKLLVIKKRDEINDQLFSKKRSITSKTYKLKFPWRKQLKLPYRSCTDRSLLLKFKKQPWKGLRKKRSAKYITSVMIHGMCKLMVPRCNSCKAMAERIRVCSKTGNTGGNGDTGNQWQKRFLPWGSKIGSSLTVVTKSPTDLRHDFTCELSFSLFLTR